MTVPPTTLAVRVVVQLPVQTLAPGDSPRALWQTVNVTASERGPGAHAHGGQCRGAIMIQVTVGRGLNGEPRADAAGGSVSIAARESWAARRGSDGTWFRVTRWRGGASGGGCGGKCAKVQNQVSLRAPGATCRTPEGTVGSTEPQ